MVVILMVLVARMKPPCNMAMLGLNLGPEVWSPKCLPLNHVHNYFST